MLKRTPIQFDFDTIVIGSGAGGSIAAHTLASAGKKVGLIEEHALGGASLNHAGIPVATLFEAAQTIETIQSAPRYGIRSGSIDLHYSSVHQAIGRSIIASKPDESAAYKTRGIRLIRGRAHFLDKYTVSVAMQRYTAKTFIIATGSSARIPNDIDGLAQTPYLTYVDIPKLATLPKSLAIVGAGASGYQFAHIFASFGVRVHLLEKASHILPHEDSEVGDLAASSLARKGVRVHTAAHITATHGDTKHTVVTFNQHSQQHRISVDTLLLTTGSNPQTDLGLENTGIRYDADGIRVDRFQRTNQNHIFAVGDSVGIGSVAAAMQSAQIAAHNILHRKQVALDTTALPRTALGMPEIACVGKTEHQLRFSGNAYQTSIAPLGITARATTEPFTSGFVKIIASHTGIVLGASIVAPQASSMLPEVSLAVRKHLHACDIANTVHSFPTWNEAVRVACAKIRCI